MTAGTYQHVCEYLTLVFGAPTRRKCTLLQFRFLRFLLNHFLKLEFGCWIEVLKLCQCLCRIQRIHLRWLCVLSSNRYTVKFSEFDRRSSGCGRRNFLSTKPPFLHLPIRRSQDAAAQTPRAASSQTRRLP